MPRSRKTRPSASARNNPWRMLRRGGFGFRWNGMGNTSAYESVPVAWDEYGNVTRYEQRPTESDEFSLGFFTLIAGIRF